MNKYLLVNKLRSLKVQLRTLMVPFIVIMFLVAYAFYAIVINMSSISMYMHSIYIVIIFLEFCSIFFLKTPLVFEIHPAQFHFTYGTVYFKREIKLIVIKRCISKLLQAFALIFILNSGFVSIIYCINSLEMAVFFILCSMLRWLKYKNYGILKILFLYFLISSNLLLVCSYDISLLSIVLLVLGYVIYRQDKNCELDYGQYLKDIIYRNRVKNASIHNNLAEMQQISLENISTNANKFKIYYLPLKRTNAIFCKAIIETFRMSKILILFFCIILFISIFVTFHPIIVANFVEDLWILTTINIAFTCFLCINIKEMYKNQVSSLYSKSKRGFFIPYSRISIVLSYSSLCCLMTSIVLITVCIIFKVCILYSFLAILICNLLIVLSIFFSYRKKDIRIISIIINSLFLLVISLLYTL